MPLPNTQQCGADTKTGKPCEATAMPNGRCRRHGGKSLSGIAHPNYQGKGKSKYLPERMRGTYEAALDDPELLVLRNDIAIIDARLYDLLQRVDSGESGKLWRDAQFAYYELLEAMRAQDVKLINSAVARIGRCLDSGVDDYTAWDEVTKAIHQRKGLAESERKRLIEARQMISVEQAMMLLTALLTTIKEHVKDTNALSAIQREFIRITSIGDHRIIDAESIE